MNFRLTVPAEISESLAFTTCNGSPRTCEYRCVFRYVSKSKDRILLDKVTKKTLVDLQKRFPKNPANSKYLAADCCGLAILLDHDNVEVTLVD